MTCHPVWSIIALPQLAKVLGSLLIALKMQEVSFLFFVVRGRNLRLELAVSGRFRIPRNWRSFFSEVLSVFFATILDPFGLALKFCLHERVHDFKPGLRGFLVWVLGLPFLLIMFPFLVDMRFPFAFICQRVICLPCLKHFWLRCDLKYAARPRIGDQGTSAVVKPLSHTLCLKLSYIFPLATVSAHLIIFISLDLCSKFNRPCKGDLTFGNWRDRPLLPEFPDNKREKLFQCKVLLFGFKECRLSCVKPLLLIIGRPGLTRHSQ